MRVWRLSWVEADETEACTVKGAVDYAALLSESAKHEIGWLVWEWGPGNGYYYETKPTVLCPAMDMTTNGTYQTINDIQPGDVNAWVKDIVITSNFGIQKTALKTKYVADGFVCN